MRPVIKRVNKDTYDVMLLGKVLAENVTEEYAVSIVYAFRRGRHKEGEEVCVAYGEDLQAVALNDSEAKSINLYTQAVTYDHGLSQVGSSSQAVTFDHAKAVGEDSTQCICFDNGQAMAGEMSQAMCRNYGRVEVGDYSQAVGGRHSKVKGGMGSALVAMDENGINAVGVVGKDGIEPDTWYKAAYGELVEV